jgi:hypothetical protein
MKGFGNIPKVTETIDTMICNHQVGGSSPFTGSITPDDTYTYSDHGDRLLSPSRQVSCQPSQL